MGKKIGVNKWAEAGARRGGRCARLACTKLRLCFRLYKLRRAFYSRNAQFDEKIQLCDVLCRTEISPCLPPTAERVPLFFVCRVASVRPAAASPKYSPGIAVNDSPLARARVRWFLFFAFTSSPDVRNLLNLSSFRVKAFDLHLHHRPFLFGTSGFLKTIPLKSKPFARIEGGGGVMQRVKGKNKKPSHQTC